MGTPEPKKIRNVPSIQIYQVYKDLRRSDNVPDVPGTFLEFMFWWVPISLRL